MDCREPDGDGKRTDGKRGVVNELIALMADHCADCGADAYLLAEIVFERGRREVQILSSNWVYDAVMGVGPEGMARLAESSRTGVAGARPRPADLSALSGLLPAERASLAAFGHAEIFCQWLACAGRRIFVLFSGRRIGGICPEAVARAAILCGYAVEIHSGADRIDTAGDRLSVRERECLRWASQGKTTDEVSLILTVSPNTVNSYLSNAIQKLGATNRAMAIATAIRSGLI